MNRFAEGTTVPIHRSRQEIDRTLQEWGAAEVHWMDSWADGAFALRFVWVPSAKTMKVPAGHLMGHRFQARIVIRLESMDELRKQAINRTTRQVSEVKLRKLLEARGRREHRLLLLWIKAAFNAVAAGMVSAEEIFLPFMEDKNGATVSEVVIPRLDKLLGAAGGFAGQLALPPGGRGE